MLNDSDLSGDNNEKRNVNQRHKGYDESEQDSFTGIVKECPKFNKVIDKPSKMVQHMKGSYKIHLENVYSTESRRAVIQHIFSAPTPRIKKKWDEENKQEVVRKHDQENQPHPIPSSQIACTSSLTPISETATQHKLLQYTATNDAPAFQIQHRYPQAPMKSQPTVDCGLPKHLPSSRDITHTLSLSPYYNQDSPMSTQHIDATFLDSFVQEQVISTQPSINVQQLNYSHPAPFTVISNLSHGQP